MKKKIKNPNKQNFKNKNPKIPKYKNLMIKIKDSKRMRTSMKMEYDIGIPNYYL